jgi:hypothetical protein
MRVAPSLLLLPAILGCSSSRTGGPEAATEASAPSAIVEAARAVAPGLGRAAPRAGLRLPSRADAPVRIEEAGVAISVEPLGLIAREAETAQGGTVFRGAARDTDVVLGAIDGGWEELRVLRTPRAEATARFRVRGGRARLVGRSVEVLDEGAVPRLRMAPPFARDALGEERALDVALRDEGAAGALVELSLRSEGLAYPIVVDPAWTSTGSLAIAHHGFGDAALLSSGVVVVAGGSIPGSPYRTATVEIFTPSSGT